MHICSRLGSDHASVIIPEKEVPFCFAVKCPKCLKAWRRRARARMWGGAAAVAGQAAVLRTLLAKRREHRVSGAAAGTGAMLTNMRVLALPPRAGCRSQVSLLFRNGMCASLFASAMITSPAAGPAPCSAVHAAAFDLLAVSPILISCRAGRQRHARRVSLVNVKLKRTQAWGRPSGIRTHRGSSILERLDDHLVDGSQLSD